MSILFGGGEVRRGTRRRKKKEKKGFKFWRKKLTSLLFLAFPKKQKQKHNTTQHNKRQFEGLKSGVGTSYESGFGVTAEPDVTVTELNGEEDRWLIVSSDGELERYFFVFFLF